MATQDMEQMMKLAEENGLTEEQETELLKLLEAEENQQAQRRKRPPQPPQPTQQSQQPTQAQPTKPQPRPKTQNIPRMNRPSDENRDTGGQISETAESGGERGDAAPQGRQRRKRAVEDELPPQPRKPTRLEKNLQNTYYSLGLLASWFNTTDGEIIASQAEARAHDVAQYASHHPEFKYWLEGFLEKSDLVMLIGGHATLVGAIMANHKLVPQDVAGAVGTTLKERIRARAERNARKAAETAAKVSGFPFQGYTPPTP